MSARPLNSLPIPPATLAALRRAGYETTADLEGESTESLSEDIKLSVQECEALLSSLSVPGPSHPQASTSSARPGNLLTQIPTQSALSLLTHAKSQSAHPIPTGCPSLNELLSPTASTGNEEGGGGLKRGTILELSGPPGSPKEEILRAIVRGAVEVGEELLFVDFQGMNGPSELSTCLGDQKEKGKSAVHFLRQHTLTDFLLFIHTLPRFLEAHPQITLLALSSLSHPFFTASPELSPSARTALLERTKSVFGRLCGGGKLTIVSTSQLANKLVRADGSRATFGDGDAAMGVMVPALGTAYLPSAKSFRVAVLPDSPYATGSLRLLSTPGAPDPTRKKEVAYCRDADGRIV